MSRPADDGVDFVVGESRDASPDEEELPEPDARSPLSRRTLAGGGAVLVAAALIARAVGGHHSPAASASSSATSSPAGPAASGRFTPRPDVIGPAPTVVPEGNRPTFGYSIRLPDCPRFATCSVSPELARGVLAAVRDQFPRAVLVSSSTVLANQSGHFEPDLLTRRLVADVGTRRLTVVIRKPKPSDSATTDRRTVKGTRTSDYVAVVHGFTVTVTVREPATTPAISLDHLAWLAGDERLVAPQ